MKKNKTKLTVVALIYLGFTLKAQDATNASGGDASGSNGSIAYSVGQVVYTTNTAVNGSIAQGVQQPYEIFVVTETAKNSNLNINLLVYPNPTTDFLTLNIEDVNNQNLSYQLYDITGKILEDKKVTDTTNMISLSNFAASTYFLKVTQNNKEVKTFKIIKN